MGEGEQASASATIVTDAYVIGDRAAPKQELRIAKSKDVSGHYEQNLQVGLQYYLSNLRKRT